MKYIKSILLLLILALVSCNNSNKEEASSEITSEETNSGTIHLSKAQFENAKMEVGQLTEKPFAETVQTSGVIDVPPQSRAVISAFSGGYIKNTPLLVGNKVSKGQRLVTLENPEFITMQQNYLETAEQLSYLKSEYDRQKIMFDEKITSQRSYLKAESEYKSNLARYNSLKKNLEILNMNPASVEAGNIVSQVNIYSPIDGNVTQVFVNTGTYVSPADKIMEIMNTDHIHLELKVFEKDLLQLKKEQDILFTVPEASKETFNGEVHLVGTSIDPNSRIAMVHGHIDEKDENNFTAGMFVEAQIITGTLNQMALPENAVVEMEGKNYVLLIENEDAEGFELRPIEVKTIANYKGFTAIEKSDQFKADSNFLTKGAFVLLNEEGSGNDH
ncbi:efflux RND transporter periplasmic adaptor subunit [Aequorivita antarctica]|uniref:Efflux RND transporter periplasmic adaptor subunit n=1 Tax=Aequorivita antarctica TaxID=153266 RepID=A0A5C6YXR6_9FLAO|nr:efflux RND transporter periplasmic adaptor subunit [Aequorivita antarctica]TXD71955.1 efflux RND transporter periplasmic adaptor subunit [Aequorivita antarctica]SRX72934.1 Nickel and cobalt resistance protein CnrB [Aequorivita antarctica]